STTLRMIAGFERPNAGRILVDGVDVTEVPVHRRNLGMVFQNYGLFPHMTVADNIAYGLKRRGVAAAERRDRVADALRMVRLPDMADRFPKQLSGGQQQRVALARALVIRPSLLLLDEPLSSLDAKLRVEMRDEIRELQRKANVTTVFVTHDQDEALSVSDRIVVMSAGHIEQMDRPEMVYSRPATRFVADFMGEANIIEGAVMLDGEAAWLQHSTGTRLPVAAEGVRNGDNAIVGIRPEAITIRRAADGDAGVRATVEDVTYRGPFSMIRCRIGPSLEIRAMHTNPADTIETFSIGDAVTLDWPAAAARSI